MKLGKSKLVTKDYIVDFKYEEAPKSVLKSSVEELIKISSANKIFRDSIKSFKIETFEF